MKQELLNLIACQGCHAPFELVDPVMKDNQIEAGSLNCEACNLSFPIVEGLPVLLDDPGAMDNTRKAFSAQWNMQSEGRFGTDEIYTTTEVDELAEFKRVFEFKDGQDLAGAVVLDAGCGSGRLTGNVAKMAPGAQIIGVDISDGAARAHARTRHIPNVHIIQANLLQLPFKPETFDYIWSEGVIHHTPNTAQTFAKLDEKLRQDTGTMYVTVYMKRALGPYKLARDVLRKAHRLPPRLLYALCVTLAIPTYIILKLRQFSMTPDRKRGFKGVVFKYHDNLSPEFQQRHTRDEVEGWFKQHGFDEVHFFHDLHARGRKNKKQAKTKAG